ncbi:MAG: dihydrolipoamide acetyltransferase family protein [Jatrophihabitantaceae bacterium]
MPDVLMPRLSDTMTEGILVQWIKHEGESVQRGDVLAEVETDKATMEVEAYDSGVLTRIIAEPGSTVPIGQPIAVIGDESGATPGSSPVTTSAPTEQPGPGSPEPKPVSPEPKPVSPVPTTASAVPPSASSSGPDAGRVPSSPLARSLARRHGLDPAQITGTGPGGRIVRADVESAIAQADEHTELADVTRHTKVVEVTDESIPLTSMRRITAQRLTESAAAPHFYLTSVVDVGALLGLRAQVNQTLGDAAPKVSVTDLLIRACAMTLRSHPQVNSSWAGDHLLRHGRVNIGFAVALDEGLIVPVLHDADRLRLTEIANEAHRLTERARSGRLAPDEFTGGTFTVSNLGTYGIDHFTAVINPPEAAILAVGAARQEPVVRGGELAVATTMKITLTVDHRVLDGATAAAFLRELVAGLEHPLRIIL